jgi:hypothetical protein
MSRLDVRHAGDDNRNPEAGLVSSRRWRVHWGWLPAAVFVAIVGWTRYGWWTLLMIAGGLGVGMYAEWKGRRTASGRK